MSGSPSLARRPPSTQTNTTPGIWGLAGYPLNGLHINLRRSLSKSKTKHIMASRMAQGMEEMEALSTEERAQIMREWHALQEDLENGRHEDGSLKARTRST